MAERTPQEILESDLEMIHGAERAAKAFIDADTKFLGLGNDAEFKMIALGALGSTVLGAYSAIIGLHQQGAWHNPNESREEAARNMDGVVADLAERLDEGSQSLAICTNVNVAEDTCTEEQAFKLETPDDVLVMARGTLERHYYADVHQTDELEPDELEAFQIALDGIEAPSERTEAFDAEVVARMDQAAEVYIAQVPKDEIDPLTTNEWIIGPGGLVLSSLLIVAGVMSRRVRMRNLRHATEAITELRNVPGSYGIAFDLVDATMKSGDHNLHNAYTELVSRRDTLHHHSGILRGKRGKRHEAVETQLELAKKQAYQKYDKQMAVAAGE